MAFVVSSGTPAFAGEDAYLPGGAMQLGPIRYRDASGGPTRTGYQLGGGQVAEGRYGHAFLSVVPGTQLRLLPGRGSGVAFTYDSWAGLRLGPVDLAVRLGMNTLGVTIESGDWRAVVASPRVGLAVRGRVSRFAAGLSFYSEYDIRIDAPDRRVFALQLDLTAFGPAEPF